MKKLIALIGAITLTTSVAAVSVVSCGMKTNQIEFTINGKKDNVKDVKGDPQQLMMNVLELLTFSERKYTSADKANKVIKTLGEKQSKEFNLYALTKDNEKYKELNKKLNSINNEGIKAFDFTNVKEDKFDKNNLEFSVIEQSYDKEKNGIYGKPKLTKKTYEELINPNSNSIWGIEGTEKDKTNDRRDAFIKFFDKLEFKMIGDWTSPKLGGDAGMNEFLLKEGETLANYKRKFSENGGFDFLVEDKKDGKKSYNFDILQASRSTSSSQLSAIIKFGDLNTSIEKAINIDLEIKGLETVMTPKGFSANDVKPVDKDGNHKDGTKTFIYTWMPTIYTFADTFQNLKDKEDIFHFIDVKLT